MAALFYTNHRIGTVNSLFFQWRELTAQRQEERMRAHQSQKKPAKKPAIQIDTELANQEAFKNYHHVNKAPFSGEEEPSEIPQGEDLRKDMMINIEEGDDLLNDEDDDTQADHGARKFLQELMKVGPFAKQILNYSYPPLLYQRGDGDEEDEDEEDEEDEDDDAAVREILEGGEGQLPDFDYDEDREI